MARSTALDLTGQTKGWLTIIKRAGTDSDRNALWECKCACGNTKKILAKSLNSGRVKSCGCKKAIRDLRRLRRGRILFATFDLKDYI